MDQIQNIMQRALDSCGDYITPPKPRRPKIPLAKEVVFKQLQEAYRIEVQNRGKDYVDDPFTQERLSKCADWLTNPKLRPSLLLYGNSVGTGKTTIAIAIMQASKAIRTAYSSEGVSRLQAKTGKYIEPGIRDYFDALSTSIRVPNFYTANQLSTIAADDKSRFNMIANCSYLIIDDLGVEPTSVKYYGTTILPLAELLCSRYESQKPTIITTNLSYVAISENYGIRVSDRLKEMCEAIPYVEKDSYR